MPPVTRRWLILILVAGAALRLIPIWFGLPYPQARPDEETAIGRALGMLEGDLNPRFFHWPSLTFYVFAAVLGVAQFAHGLVTVARDFTFTEQALIGRAVVAVAGTATIFVLYHLARRVAGETVALLASAFLAVAILHVRESHFAMTDVFATLLTVTSLAHLMTVVPKPVPQGTVLMCALAGLAAGLATSAKYSAGAVAFSMIALQGLWFAGQPRLALTVRGWAPSLAYGAALLAGFLATTPYAVLDYPTFWRDLQYDFEHLSAGHRGVILGRGWVYHLTHSLPYGLGVPVFLAAVAGIVPLARHHARAALVLGTFVAVFYYAIGGGQTVFFRYVLPLLPVLCLSAAVGVSRAAAWLAPRLDLRYRVTFAVLVLATAGPALVHSAWFDLLLAKRDTRTLAGDWLTPRLRPEDSLHDTGSSYTRLDLWQASYERWEYEERRNAFVDADGHLPDWLVLQSSPLSAYASTPPGLRQLAQTSYVRVYSAQATRWRPRSAVYDYQDAFFLPISAFWTVERPGPDIEIYRRRDLPPAETGE